jgi:membrane associated rhomboid family serine protease
MSLGFPRPTPIVLATLVTLLAVFIVSAIGYRFAAGRAVYETLALHPHLVLTEGRAWMLVTYALLHSLDSPFHLVMNGLVFYWFGPTMESRWGQGRFLFFMFVAALAGGLFVLGAYVLGLKEAGSVVGASSITMALVVAWGFTFPDRQVYFFFFAVRGIQLIWITIAFEILNALTFSRVSAAGHFGGIVVGFLYGESSPVRRYFLKRKLKRLEAQSAALRAPAPKRRAGGPELRVIRGGQDDEPPKDKRYLN